MATYINYTSTGQKIPEPMKLTKLKVHQLYVCEVPLGTTCYNRYLHPSEYKAWNKVDVFEPSDNHLQELMNWQDAFMAQKSANNQFMQNVLVCGQGGEKWMTSWQELMLSNEYGFTNNFRDFLPITKELIERRRGKQKYIEWTALRMNTSLTNIPIAASFYKHPEELKWAGPIPEFAQIATKGIFRIAPVQINNMTGQPVANMDGRHIPSTMLDKLFEWSKGHIPTAMFKNIFNTQAFVSEIDFPEDTEIQIKQLPIIRESKEQTLKNNSTRKEKPEQPVKVNKDYLLTKRYLPESPNNLTAGTEEAKYLLYQTMIVSSGIKSDLTSEEAKQLNDAEKSIKMPSLFEYINKLYMTYLGFIYDKYKNAAYYIAREPNYTNMLNYNEVKINVDYKCEMGYCISINKPFCAEDVNDVDGRHFVHVSNSTFELLQKSFPDKFVAHKFNFDQLLYKHAHYHQVIVLIGKTQHIAEYKHLKLKYLEINERLFSGKCLTDTVLVYAGKDSKKDIKIDWDYLDGVSGYFAQSYARKSSVIVINSQYVNIRDMLNAKDTHRTLIHEMCHAYTYSINGTTSEPVGAMTIFENWPEKHKDQSFCHGLRFLQAVSKCAEQLNQNWYDIFGYNTGTGLNNVRLRPEYKQYAYEFKKNYTKKTSLDKLPKFVGTSENWTKYVAKCEEFTKYCENICINIINTIINNSDWLKKRFNKTSHNDDKNVKLPHLVITSEDGTNTFYAIKIEPCRVETCVTRLNERRCREDLTDFSKINVEIIRFFADDRHGTKIKVFDTQYPADITQDELTKEIVKAIVYTF